MKLNDIDFYTLNNDELYFLIQKYKIVHRKDNLNRQYMLSIIKEFLIKKINGYNKNTKSILVSTQKDYVRIPKSYRSLVNTLEGEIVFKNEEFLINLLSNVIENFSLKK